MAESLQDRLRGHSQAFDGLLSLIPAKMYYGEEQDGEQWNKKKQSKAKKKAAKKARLDPDSELNRSAKEVMDERAKNKRKLQSMEQDEDEVDEVDEDEDDYEAVPGVEAEKPGEGLKVRTEKPAEPNKKQKTDSNEVNGEEEEDVVADAPSTDNGVNGNLSARFPGMTKAQQKMALKKEKAQKRSEQKKAKKEENRDKQAAAAAASGTTGPAQAVSTRPAETSKTTAPEEPESDSEGDGGRQIQGQQRETKPKEAEEEASSEGGPTGQDVAFSGMHDADDTSARSTPPSLTFDTTDATKTDTPDLASTSTSISSTVPPSEKPKHIKLPADMDIVRARVAARIEALRAARKADGPDGKPIKTRQELIESRRAKQAQRKAHKQELRKQAKLEENEKRERALASNSPSMMSPALELDGSGGFSFGRVAFGDGSRLSHDLTYVLSGGKRRGPSDPKTALLKVQNQKQRLQELDADKREDIAEKEAWLTARRRAEGEKIRDDEAILKKAVKRKEIAKKKSESAWKDRAKGVEHAQREKQKKREENLKKRREDKMLGKAGKKKKVGAGAKKARPGFEGSLGVGGRRK